MSSEEAFNITDSLGENNTGNPKPFLKWVGGKRQLLSRIFELSPQKYNMYYEPFIGGGAVFFALKPQNAFISDINSELINTYKVVRDNCQELISELSKHKYEKEYFYKTRELDRGSDYKNYCPIKKAARFIYLNKTCFNGLYRVNKKGFFNTPFGSYKNPTIVDKENLYNCSALLQKSSIQNCSYKDILEKVVSGDFVYLDPPYAPLSKTSDFTSYTKEGFGLEEQQQLSDFCKALDKKGVFFLLSNSTASEILDLYKDFNITKVDALRAINSKGSGRGAVSEILVRNYV